MGFDRTWPYVAELFEMDDLVRDLARDGIAVDVAALRPAWDDTVDNVLREATLARPTWQAPGGGRRGVHTEAMGYLLAEMQHLHRRIRGDVVSAVMQDVRAVVADVLDPEVPVLTIEDLGILRDVRVDEDGHVEVVITPTYSGCPALEAIEASIVETLHAAGHDDVAVTTVLAPAWTTDWMSEEEVAESCSSTASRPRDPPPLPRRSGARFAWGPLPAVRFSDDTRGATSGRRHASRCGSVTPARSLSITSRRSIYDCRRCAATAAACRLSHVARRHRRAVDRRLGRHHL